MDKKNENGLNTLKTQFTDLNCKINSTIERENEYIKCLKRLGKDLSTNERKQRRNVLELYQSSSSRNNRWALKFIGIMEICYERRFTQNF